MGCRQISNNVSSSAFVTSLTVTCYTKQLQMEYIKDEVFAIIYKHIFVFFLPLMFWKMYLCSKKYNYVRNFF